MSRRKDKFFPALNHFSFNRRDVVYAALIFAACVAVWQMTSDSAPVENYKLYTSNSGYTHPIKTLPPDDYHRLIDITNFSFTKLHVPCNDSVLLLILIHSNPSNFETRKTIRDTWGKSTPRVKILFMSGLVENATMKVKLEEENEKHADIVRGSFVDAYRNMTYKHVMVFKYAIYHCPQAKYILKSDDDVFVNTPLMVKFLTDLSPFGGSKMMFCNVKVRARVRRSYRSKWRVSFKDYPHRTYPPYCLGWIVLYSPDVVFDLYKEAQKSDFFWIDDVHITGTLAHRVHLSHVDVDKWVLSHTWMYLTFKRVVRLTREFLFGGPDLTNEDIEALWEYIHE